MSCHVRKIDRKDRQKDTQTTKTSNEQESKKKKSNTNRKSIVSWKYWQHGKGDNPNRSKGRTKVSVCSVCSRVTGVDTQVETMKSKSN